MKQWSLVCVCLWFFCLPYVVAQDVNWNLPAPEYRVTSHVNGLNMGGYSYGLMAEQDPMKSDVTERCNCFNLPVSSQRHEIISVEPSADMVEKSAKIKPGIIRFPGGTQANWYHLYEYGDDWLYDASNPTVARGLGIDYRESYAIEEGVNQFCKEDARLQADENYIDLFVQYINAMKSTSDGPQSVEVSFVVNLLKHFRFFNVGNCGRNYVTFQPWADYDPHERFDHSYSDSLFGQRSIYRFELFYKETLDALDFIYQNTDMDTSDVIYVEMGNEYYFSNGINSAYGPMGMNASDYAYLVELYSQRLKTYFEGKVQIKVGVTSEPNTVWQLQLIQRFDADVDQDGRTFYDAIDAVVLHEYLKDPKCDSIALIGDRFHCARAMMSDFIHGPNHLLASVQNFNENFPGKNIWLTEWNMVNGRDGELLSFINTILHAAFIQETLLELIRYNQDMGAAIEMAMHHRLGFDRQWSVLQMSDGVDTAVVRVGAHVFQFISELYQRDTTYALGDVLTSNGVSVDPTQAVARAFYQPADHALQQDRILIYFSNKHADDVPFALPNSLLDKNITAAAMSYIQGDALYSYGPSNTSKGRNEFTLPSGETYFDEELNDLVDGQIHDAIDVTSHASVAVGEQERFPAYSVGVLTVDLETNLSTNHHDIRRRTINVFPNPAQDQVAISVLLKSSEKFSASLQTLEGKVIWTDERTGQEGEYKVNISLADVPAGVYLLRSQIGDEFGVNKLIVF